jgi:predicted GIY-YIG superfamily endonuclease
MSGPRDTFRYQFKIGNKIVHRGITNDLDRREAEHQASRQPWANGHIVKIGNITTREAAQKWEAGQAKTETPPRRSR